MKSYLSLVPISAKVHKRQNRLTLICIILSVFLVTAIFSMADIWTKMEGDAMISKHGNYHVILSGISESEAEQIAERDDVAVSAGLRVVNYDVANADYHIEDKNLILYEADQAYIADIRNYETEGSCPWNSMEVMLSADAKEGLGVQVGDRITIHTPVGDFDYTVSGFCDDDTEYNTVIDGVCAYMNAGGFHRIFAAGFEDVEPVYYIRFDENTKLKKTVADIKEQYGLTDGNVEENKVTMGLAGASSNKTISDLYPLAAMMFLLILTAGVLMISSCLNSNVSQRIQFFGMMRCIGASKKQIIHFVRLEALNWCKSAVPMGCGLGIVVTWIMCIFLKNVVGGEFVGLSFRFSILGIVCGAAVGVIAVLIAAHSPAKRAAGVSPIAAVSGNAETGKTITHGANTHLFKIETALGVHHAVSAKKNLILMTLSFAFMVILFFSFFAFLDFIRALLPSLGSFTPAVSIASADNRNSVARSLVDEIAEIPGVKEAFGNAFALDTPADINGVGSSVDLISYDDYMLNWSRKSQVSGDISKVTDDSNYVLSIYNQGSSLDVGDKIMIGDTELEVACIVSEGIGGFGRPLVICSEGTFRRITGENNYMMLNVQFAKDATEETVNRIRDLAGDYIFEDRREENSQSYSSYWVFRIAAYGFLAIIALITVFNIMNSISMSVSARIKQYGAMRAVGMGVRQLTKMIASEAATYAVCGLFTGCVVGLYLHRFITVKLIIDHFGGHWKIPLEPIAVIIPIAVLSCIAAVRTPARRIRDMAITDTINEL